MGVHSHCVLIVDDHEDTAEGLRLVLELHGFDRTRIAANGAEALTMLRRGFRPCVILLDMLMPVMDGPTFLEAKHADPALAPIPVIVLSDSVMDRQAVARSVALMLKPVDIDQLLALVSDQCASVS